MGAYFPYYFYRAFNISHLEFHAKYGVLIFLILPFIIFFCIFYPLGMELMSVIYIGMIIPFIYAFYMVYNILMEIQQRYRNQKASFAAFLAYIAVSPLGTHAASGLSGGHPTDRGIVYKWGLSGHHGVISCFSRLRDPYWYA